MQWLHIKENASVLVQNEIPENIYILNNEILNEKPSDICFKATIEKEILEKLNYDDTPPVDNEGNRIEYIDKSTQLNNKQHIKHTESRKKKEL